MKKYIDVSRWQLPTQINYDLLVKQIDGAILRIGTTDGRTEAGKDSQFENHYREFTKRGVPLGVYFFSNALTVEECKKEVDATVSYMAGREFALPVALDVEDEAVHGKLSKRALTDLVVAWLEYAESKGLYVTLYASQSWFKYKLDMKRLDAYDIWVADTRTPLSNPYPDRAGMWQYSHTGRLEGYNGDIDLNEVYKDYPTIIKNAGLNNYAKPVNTVPEPTPAPVPAPTPALKPVVKTYKVKKGDTLSGIAAKYGTTWQKLAEINKLPDPNLIKVGQVLKLEGDAPVAPANRYVTYVVKAGDTLSEIAIRYNTDYQEIANLNGIQNPNKIYVGQVIRIKVR